MRTGLCASLALLAACGSGGGTGNEAQAQARSVAAVKPLDIAGVRPGMAAEQMLSVLRQAGWTIGTDPGQTWEEAVQEAVDRRRNTYRGNGGRSGVYAYRAKKGEESLYLVMHPVAGGGIVNFIQYRAPDAGRSYDQIRTSLIQRYGPPTRGALPGRTPIGYERPDGSTLKLDMSSQGMMLTLSGGAASQAAWRASLDRAVNARIGTVGRSF